MHPDIRSVPLFSALSEAQLQRILEGSHNHLLQEGQQLFMAGDAALRFFLVLSGQIKLFRLSSEGQEKIIEIIQPGNSFAEALMFLDRPSYPVSASALLQSQLISFENQRFLDVLHDSTETCLRLMGIMSQRLRGLIKEIDDLTLQSASSRLCYFLLKQMTESGSHRLTLPAAKHVLATRLSMKPETFSRILSDLAERGIIEKRGNEILVVDLPRLRTLANAESVTGLEPSTRDATPSPRGSLTEYQGGTNNPIIGER